MRAQRQDGNAKAIDDALKAVGASVENLPGGNGRPDRLVGFRGRSYLLEYKRPRAKRSINPSTFDRQQDWRLKWAGAQPVIVDSPAQALAVIGAGGWG